MPVYEYSYMINYKRSPQTARAIQSIKRNQSMIINWLQNTLIPAHKELQKRKGVSSGNLGRTSAISVTRLKVGDILLLKSKEQWTINEILLSKHSKKIRLSLSQGKNFQVAEYDQSAFVLLVRQVSG